MYFVYENDQLHEVLSTIETSSGYEAVSLPEKIFNTLLGDNYQLTVSTKEQSALKQVTGTNIQGWLGGNGDVSSPTIAIVASYDSLAASPDLAKSTTSSTSSTAILLELVRVFNKLYSQPRTQSNYNLLFLLTTGGHFNFYGSKQWLSEADDRLVKSLEAVICLDSLGEGRYFLLRPFSVLILQQPLIHYIYIHPDLQKIRLRTDYMRFVCFSSLISALM